MYLIELMPKAIKDLKNLQKIEAKKVVEKIKLLKNGLIGDIKKLTNYTPEYRLRVGNYRVLFEIENQKIIVYHIKHRKDAYL
ncbi:plasmid stabilization protein [Achromatium sp. WMS3]|nr:plasmid stabilization protein [Achromatium sp. WMS3]